MSNTSGAFITRMEYELSLTACDSFTRCCHTQLTLLAVNSSANILISNFRLVHCVKIMTLLLSLGTLFSEGSVTEIGTLPMNRRKNMVLSMAGCELDTTGQVAFVSRRANGIGT